MSLPIWVKSLQARIERDVGEKPHLMVTYIAGEEIEEWGLAVRFSNKGKRKYLRREINARGLAELMDDGNRMADDFAEFLKEQDRLDTEIPF